MAAAHLETIFAPMATDVLGDAVPSLQLSPSDLGLLRERVIVRLLERVPLVPAAAQAIYSRLMQSGVITSEAISSELKCTVETGTSPAIARNETAPALPSRFDQDFERLELLGRGAFGEVWRCRHRLDGHEYAIKAVQYRAGANAGQIEQQVLQEASTWARFNHPNVVRYHSSWVEVQQKHIVEDESNPQFSPLPLAHEHMSALSMDTSGSCTSDLTDEWSFEESDSGVLFETSNLATKPKSTSSRQAAALPDSVDFTAATATHCRRPSALARQEMPLVPGYVATLYLQAELCRKDTLMAWIAQRNAAMASGLTTPLDQYNWAKQGLDIFRQIVVGLAHLHAQSCAHRDVKPSNILFGCDGNVRLGDFGLAKFVENMQQLSLWSDSSSCSPQQRNSSLDAAKQQHTRVVGTAPYASPEQLEGRPCGVETDVYALGMILAEMLCPVSTQMERVVLLEGLRSGRQILGDSAMALPVAARLAVAMTSPDPLQRPLMCEILEAFPEVEREVALCFGNETAPCNKAASICCRPRKELALCSSSATCQFAVKQMLLQKETSSQTRETAGEATDSAKIEDLVKGVSFAVDAHEAGTAHSGHSQWPPYALSASRVTCEEAASSRNRSRNVPTCRNRSKNVPTCSSSSSSSSYTACQSASEQILLQEQQASQQTEKMEEVMISSKKDVFSKFSSQIDARAAGTGPSGCQHCPPFALPAPKMGQQARVGHVDPDRAAQRHHCRPLLTAEITRQTATKWVPSGCGRRGRRQGRRGRRQGNLCNRGRRHLVAAFPSYSMARPCSS